ncbi:MAG: SHOCT domain-containing protein [Candidatus Wenzhouxiangella sp. M2_3B_020]
MFDGMHDGCCWGMDWGMHWGWWLFLVLLVALVVFAIWAVSRSAGSRRQSRTREETPLERLQRRYAEGEISTEEYEERKSRLG